MKNNNFEIDFGVNNYVRLCFKHKNSKFDESLTIWSENDIKTHKLWIIDTVNKLKEKFASK